jgi:hypothetical protein
MYEVVVSVRQFGEDPKRELGVVGPLTVDGRPVYVRNDDLLDRRSPSDEPVNVHDAMDGLWTEWREEAGQSGAEGGFTDWLVAKKRWKYAEAGVLRRIVETWRLRSRDEAAPAFPTYQVQHEMDDEPTYVVRAGTDEAVVTFDPSLPWQLRQRLARLVVAELERSA